MTKLLLKLSQLLTVLLFLMNYMAFAADGIGDVKKPRQFSTTAIPSFEHILSFDVLASFNPDGSMEVQENISVLAMRGRIRQGIFRTLPDIWERRDGRIFRANYTVMSVLRNGVPELFQLDQQPQAVIVRIGSAGHILRPGIYHYQIRYKVSNHFSRSHGKDELYWNVTGSSWPWPISRASFRLQLPNASENLNAQAKDRRLHSIEAFSVMAGSKRSAATILPDGSVRTIRSMAKGEGLTVVYSWPQAVLANAPQPKAIAPLVHLLIPTPETLVIWLPLLLMIGYYYCWWQKNVIQTGLKMPAIISLDHVPNGMTPGYLRFLIRRDYDDIAFSSDVLGLVTKRAVALVSGKRDALREAGVILRLSLLTTAGDSRLDRADKALVSQIFSGKRKNLPLCTGHQPSLHKARRNQEKYYDAQRERLFRKWGPPLRHCIYLSLLMPAACAIWVDFRIALITIPVLFLWLVGGAIWFFLARFLCHRRDMWRFWGPVPLILGLIFGSLTTWGGYVLMFMQPVNQLPAGYLGGMAMAFAFLVFVSWRTPRYTQRGLNELAVAKGVKLYLASAQKENLHYRYPPAQIMSHFETLLPVAVGLGLGKEWMETFADYLRDHDMNSQLFAGIEWNDITQFCECCHACSMAAAKPDSGAVSQDLPDSSYGSSDSGFSDSSSGGDDGGGGGW